MTLVAKGTHLTFSGNRNSHVHTFSHVLSFDTFTYATYLTLTRYHQAAGQKRVGLDCESADLALSLSRTGIVRVQAVWNNARRDENGLPLAPRPTSPVYYTSPVYSPNGTVYGRSIVYGKSRVYGHVAIVFLRVFLPSHQYMHVKTKRLVWFENEARIQSLVSQLTLIHL